MAQVVAWGSPYYGGDSAAVHDQLVDVRKIQAANSAFAAIRGDAWPCQQFQGFLVTWSTEHTSTLDVKGYARSTDRQTGKGRDRQTDGGID